MKLTRLLLVISFSLTSCATYLNKSNMKIDLFTTEPSKIVIYKDTIQTYNNKIRLAVPRSEDPLDISTITDNRQKEITIKSKHSVTYFGNIINYGIGFLVDRNTPKRFTYPKKIFINTGDLVNTYYRFGYPDSRGDIYLHLSLPHINVFRLVPENESVKSNMGFWGITAGLDYYYDSDRFFNMGVSAVSDFFCPVPAAIDISGEYELMSSVYLSFSNNYKMKRFSLGYGLSFSKNTWDFRYYDIFNPPPATREPVKKTNNALGLIMTSYFQLSQRFNIGIIYRPTFYRFNAINKFQYEHLISIDFAWKIKL